MNAAVRKPMMPQEAPLAMPDQDLSRPFRDPNAPAWDRRAPVFRRLFVFCFAALMSLGLGLIFADWFAEAGLSRLEGLLIGLVVFTFFWIALPVGTALVGITLRKQALPVPETGLDVALLMPLYGEDMGKVAANARAMLEGLSAPGIHRFSLYFLSDTRSIEALEIEKATVKMLRRTLPGWAIWYRHRDQNTGFKAGNIREWVSQHGAAHDAMLVLDADSLMSGAAIRRLADEMAFDPAAGLIQSIPQLINADTVFARMQQFSNAFYGDNLARGLAAWSGASANYWGHNAIIRTSAFAASAGLPVLRGRGPFTGPVLSHDFVEAALIRRAGWAVRFLPDALESFEETPPTIAAHVLRDRRWCTGNMQHLRLIFAPGLSLTSRFHLFQGAMGYVSSVAWFILLILWALWGLAETSVIVSYFSDANPLFPTWPEMDLISKVKILGFVYGMLLAPKLIGVASTVIRGEATSVTGWRFPVSLVFEILLSILYAPMMMVQHMIAVFRALLGQDNGWSPDKSGKTGWLALLRFHLVEVLIGGVMSWACWSGLISLWLLPIAVCLAIAPLLSRLGGLSHRALFRTPQETNPCAEVQRAQQLQRPAPAQQHGKDVSSLPPHAVPAE